MSKRKRTVSEGSAQSRREDESLPGKFGRTSDRNDMYEDAYMEIRHCKQTLDRAKSKLKVLSDHVEDWFTIEAIESLDKAFENFEQSVEFLNKSKEKFIKFNCIPHIPMKQIVQYLDLNSKRNLRRTSKQLKHIVDCSCDTFKTCTVISFNKYEFRDKMKSDMNLNLNFNYQVDEIVAGHLPRFLALNLNDIQDRIVNISGPPDLFTIPEYKGTLLQLPNVKEIQVTGEYHNLGSLATLNRLEFPQSLKILKFREIVLEDLNEEDSCLDQLEELHIHRVSGCDGLQTLLSASRNIKQLFISNITEEDVLDADFRMPNLRKLKLKNCSPEFVYILTGSASSLTDICLHGVDLDMFSSYKWNIPNLSRLSVACPEDDSNIIHYKKLVTQLAPRIQELHLRNIFNFGMSTPDFPKLERLFCEIRQANEAVDIVKHSKSLKFIIVDDDVYPVLKAGQPHTLYLDTYSDVDETKFMEPFMNPPKKFEELCLAMLKWNIPSNMPVISDSFNLTKITLIECNISGIENIVNQCCYTLEEFNILDSILTTQSRSTNVFTKMKALKKISIKYEEHGIYFDRRGMTSNLNNIISLLKSSSATLEKLTLEFQSPDLFSGESMVFHILKSVKLTNLKILQYHTQLEGIGKEKSNTLISRNLPENVTVWQFKPDFSEIEISTLRIFNAEMIQLIGGNAVHVDVASD